MLDGRRRSVRLGVAATALMALRCLTASAAGDAAGSLGAGGTASGDVSRTAGETDRITVDVAAGATLAITLKATFHAALALLDPDGTPVPVTLAGSGRQRGSVDVARGGTYAIAISSADGSQGIYKLVAKQVWPRAVAIAGQGTTAFTFGMPAGGTFACTVQAEPGSAAPEIARIVGPDGLDLLAAPIVVRGRAARLAPTTATLAGAYALTVDADAASAWTGRITRRVPRVPPTTLRLANGLDAISFRGDGVGAVFSRHCAPCHGWASSYGGVRRYAFDAIARMTSGAMPPGGGLSGAEIALVKAWISTGRQP